MRKILAVVLSILICFVCACGSDTKQASGSRKVYGAYKDGAEFITADGQKIEVIEKRTLGDSFCFTSGNRKSGQPFKYTFNSVEYTYTAVTESIYDFPEKLSEDFKYTDGHKQYSNDNYDSVTIDNAGNLLAFDIYNKTDLSTEPVGLDAAKQKANEVLALIIDKKHLPDVSVYSSAEQTDYVEGADGKREKTVIGYVFSYEASVFGIGYNLLSIEITRDGKLDSVKNNHYHIYKRYLTHITENDIHEAEKILENSIEQAGKSSLKESEIVKRIFDSGYNTPNLCYIVKNSGAQNHYYTNILLSELDYPI